MKTASLMVMLTASLLLPGDATSRQRLLRPGDVDALPAKPADARIPYGPAASQFGDLRLPAGKGPFPLAIVIHGGCFVSKIASLQNSTAMADALRDAGLATWNIEYRGIDLAGGGWPGTYLDVGAAADHVKTLSEKYPIDRSRVISVGHSAGAVLSLWLAGRGRIAADSLLHVRDPIKLAGVVGIGADGDLPPIGPALTRLCGSNAVDVFFEKPANPLRLAQANPANMLPAGIPQLLISGSLDPFEPPAQKAAYMSKVRASGDRVDELTIAEVGHFEVIAPGSAAWPRVRDAILRFARVATAK